ncbi:hypothetical protein B0H34DRAFT_652603, partial [Crassisporium funariophilum]
IMEKHSIPPPEPQSPVEAPPAYEALSPGNANQDTNRLIDQPPAPITHFSSSSNSVSPPSFRGGSTPKAHTRSLSSSSTNSLKGRKASWFKLSSSTPSRTETEVRSTVLGLVRDLVQDHSSGSPAALGILRSCAEACTTHSVSLSSILQEKFIENHTPLYWAIVKRRRSDDLQEVESPESPESDLISALLSQSKPLNPDTILDMRLACLATSDQPMFQRLRLSPQFSSISGSDKILLGADLPPDDVMVEIGPGEAGAFAVNFEIPQFHKRMMVSKEISLEFVARNRLWRFAFMIIPDDAWYGPPPGSWCVSLSLLEPSPPTWLDARVILVQPDGPEIIDGPAPSEPPPQSNFRSATNALINSLSSQNTKGKSPMALRLTSKQMMEAPRNSVPATKTVVSIDESSAFASLQYS